MNAEKLREKAEALLKKAEALEAAKAQKIGQLMIKYFRNKFEGIKLEDISNEIEKILRPPKA